MYAVSTKSFSGDVLLHESTEYFESIENANKYYETLMKYSEDMYFLTSGKNLHEIHIYGIVAKDKELENMIENVKNHVF